MREIKFRQHCKDSNKFYYWGVNIGDYVFTSPTMIGGCRLKSPHEQYSGFKDCNANEIYDGDILKVNDNGKEYVGIVEYYGSGFMVKYGTFKEFIGFVARQSEVVGNIHENPELLEIG